MINWLLMTSHPYDWLYHQSLKILLIFGYSHKIRVWSSLPEINLSYFPANYFKYLSLAAYTISSLLANLVPFYNISSEKQAVLIAKSVLRARVLTQWACPFKSAILCPFFYQVHIVVSSDAVYITPLPPMSILVFNIIRITTLWYFFNVH